MKFNDLLDNLSFSIDDCIRRTIEEYGDYIHEDIRDELWNHKDTRELFVLNKKKTVSFFVENGKILIPELAYTMLKIARFIPGYGIKKDHKCYENNELFTNKTYWGYIRHVFLAGLSFEDFCKETLPHEVIHLCGGRGGNPLMEALTELKAREVSIKYGLPLSRCGYEKELKYAVLVQDIFGKDLTNRITFSASDEEIKDIITSELGEKSYTAFCNLRYAMMEKSKISPGKSSGILAAIKKAVAYTKINYDNVIWDVRALENTVKGERFAKRVQSEEHEFIDRTQTSDIEPERPEDNIDIDIEIA